MTMNYSFETLGNATVQLFQQGQPVLATDPWLVGSCYYGSWALDHPLTAAQIAHVQQSKYVWISHGHPDHLHDESLALIPKGKQFLLPDHYSQDIFQHLVHKGFEVTILPYRRWFGVTPTIEVMCLDNLNQDAILIIRVGDALIINLNDSPIVGEHGFIRRLAKGYPRTKTYLLALCSVDADMFNFADASGAAIKSPPEERKPQAVREAARLAARLGVGNFCCSSSQHIYVRPDSLWANPYRISWFDMQKYWNVPGVRPIEPFASVDLESGAVTANHPSHVPDDSESRRSARSDNWDEPLSGSEWHEVEAWIRRYELIRGHFEFIEISVGRDTKRFDLDSGRRRRRKMPRGIHFWVPRQSLLETVRGGYFDDLLIGNFMKVHLSNAALYPRFTPIVAKIGDNARVYTRREYRRFLYRYLRRNWLGTAHYLAAGQWEFVLLPLFRRWAERWGVKRPLKLLFRTVRRGTFQ
jgi:hypothetical protein